MRKIHFLDTCNVETDAKQLCGGLAASIEDLPHDRWIRTAVDSSYVRKLVVCRWGLVQGKSTMMKYVTRQIDSPPYRT